MKTNKGSIYSRIIASGLVTASKRLRSKPCDGMTMSYKAQLYPQARHRTRPPKR